MNFRHLSCIVTAIKVYLQPGGGGTIPSNRLMKMCRWMGSHFHDWIDYNVFAFPIELLEWGRIFSGFGGNDGAWVLKKYRTICGTKIRVKYVFYVHYLRSEA